jgi:hypothetical protein
VSDSKGSYTATASPTSSDRKIQPVGVLKSPVPNIEKLLSEIAPPPPPSIREVVEAQVADVGPRAAAESVRDDRVILPAEKRARIEEVVRLWSAGSPAETWNWIVDQLEDEERNDAFNQAAISGYIESVALIDPEAAVNAADLLDPTIIEADEAGQPDAGIPISADPGFPGDPGFLTRNRK